MKDLKRDWRRWSRSEKISAVTILSILCLTFQIAALHGL
jgi:hypothetical protein